MRSELVEQAMNLTQESLYRFWRADCSFVLSLLDEDIVWIGAVQYQYMRGLEQVKKDFQEIVKEQQKCHLMNQEFMVAQNSGNVCTISGRYIVTSDDEKTCYVRAQQRCIFVWELKDDRLKIKLINVSNPLGELQIAADEKFVNTVGKMTSKYLHQKIKTMTNQKKIVLPDEKGAIRFIHESEVFYIVAEKKNCVFYTTDGIIPVKKSFSEVFALLSDDFVQVHRSYAVNQNYIKEIIKFNVVMKDGSQIPVPKKKYGQVLALLNKIHTEE